MAVLAAVLVLLLGCGTATTGPKTGSPGVLQPTPSQISAPLAPTRAITELASVGISALPPEARQTLQRIRDGGPFPYPKDGTTFGNRERLLPKQVKSFYREYTVDTPGSLDRGARRIVAGDNGCRFYTDDHYASFREVIS